MQLSKVKESQSCSKLSKYNYNFGF